MKFVCHLIPIRLVFIYMISRIGMPLQNINDKVKQSAVAENH